MVIPAQSISGAKRLYVETSPTERDIGKLAANGSGASEMTTGR